MGEVDINHQSARGYADPLGNPMEIVRWIMPIGRRRGVVGYPAPNIADNASRA